MVITMWHSSYVDRRSSQWEIRVSFGSFNHLLEIKAWDLITLSILSRPLHIKGWYLAQYLPCKFDFVKDLTNFNLGVGYGRGLNQNYMHGCIFLCYEIFSFNYRKSFEFSVVCFFSVGIKDISEARKVFNVRINGNNKYFISWTSPFSRNYYEFWTL